jgi:hypothetical protein
MAKEEQSLSRGKGRTAYNRATFGTAIPNVEQIRAYEQLQADQAVAEEIKKSGGELAKTGMSPTGAPEYTMGMSPNAKFFSEGRALDASQLKRFGGERFKSFGDKADFETEKALRKLKGQQALYDDPNQFVADIDKSVAIGGASAINSPEGRERAVAAGVQSGLSFEDSDAIVQSAFEKLKQVGKRNKEATPAALATTAAAKATADKAAADVAAETARTKSATTPTTPAIAYEVAKPEPSLIEETMPYVGAATRGLAGGRLLAATGRGKALLNTGGMNAKGAADNAKALADAARKALGQEKRLRILAQGGNVTVKQAEAAMEATKMTKEAAEEAAKMARVAKFVSPTSGVAKFGVGALKGASKLAAPVAVGMEVYDAAKFALDEEARAEMMKEAEENANRNFAARAALGALSPTKTILTTGANIKDMLSSNRAARESEANLKTAENRLAALTAARQQDYSDAEWAKLPPATKSKYMFNLRKNIR